MVNDLETPALQPRKQAGALALCALLGGVGLWIALQTGGLLACILALFLLLGVRIHLRPRSQSLGLVVKVFAAFCIVTVLLGAGMLALWESGAEVVVLHQRDEQGEAFSTRLWIIDFNGHPSFMARPPDSQRRISLLREYPNVELARDGRVECRKAVLLPAPDEVRDRMIQPYTQKYEFRAYVAGRLVGVLLGGRPGPKEREILVQLEPCETAPVGPPRGSPRYLT